MEGGVKWSWIAPADRPGIGQAVYHAIGDLHKRVAETPPIPLPDEVAICVMLEVVREDSGRRRRIQKQAKRHRRRNANQSRRIPKNPAAGSARARENRLATDKSRQVSRDVCRALIP